MFHNVVSHSREEKAGGESRRGSEEGGGDTNRTICQVCGWGRGGRWLIKNFYLSFLVMHDHTESHVRCSGAPGSHELFQITFGCL